MTQTPEQIAAGLTKAQRKWLPWFPEAPLAGRPIGMSKATLRGLIEERLVEEHRPHHFGMVKWNVTPLGLAVRTILENRNDA